MLLLPWCCCRSTTGCYGTTRPAISSAVITGCLFLVLAGAAYVTLMILQANAGLTDQIFATIGLWLDNPATHPGAFGVTISKDLLMVWLAKGNALFVNYWTTLANNLLLIVVKGLVFFISFFLLLLKGTAIRDRIYRHLPQPVRNYWDQLTPVTVDTLYVIYIVQFAIAALTFFIAIPVFYLLGYGNILFYSFLAAFCEAIPILGSSVAFIIIGAYALAAGRPAGGAYHVHPGIPCRLCAAGDLRAPGARGPAGENPPGDHVCRAHRRSSDDGACRFCAWAA